MNQLKDTLRRAKVILLAIGVVYGGSALSDIAVDEAGDIKEINRITQINALDAHPSSYENSNEAIGKGIVSMLSFLLYSYSRTPRSTKIDSSQKVASYLVKVSLPFNKNITSGRVIMDELISVYFQNHERSFIDLITHAFPPGTKEVIRIDNLVITKKGNELSIVIHYSIVSFDELKHFAIMVMEAISDICKNLFLEKMDRIGQECLSTSTSNFEDIIGVVVNRQISEKGLDKKSSL